jgi:hypothetical protein
VKQGPVLAAAAPAAGRARIHASRGGPAPLAASGHGWAAFRKGRVLAVTCARFAGTRDVACTTNLGERPQHLALNCVQGLTADVTAHGRTATWSCAGDNRAGLLLAWRASPASTSITRQDLSPSATCQFCGRRRKHRVAAPGPGGR